MALLHSLPKHRPRVIFCDVDDTIAPSTQPVSPAMAALLVRLADAGYQLGFVSGGSVEQISGQVSAKLDRPHLLLGTSGSHAVQVGPDGARRELFRLGFSVEERADILGALAELIGHFGIRTDTTLEDQLQDRGCQFTLSALGRGAAESRKRAFDPDGSKRREWVRFLTERLGDGRFSLRVGGTTSVDITAHGVDKASGLRRLLDLLGWPAEEALYFGDRFEETGNDHPVLALMDCVGVSSPEESLAHFQALLGRG